MAKTEIKIDALTLGIYCDLLMFFRNDEYGFAMIWERLGQPMTREDKRSYENYFRLDGAISELQKLSNPQ